MKKIVTLIILILPIITFCQKVDTLSVYQNDTSFFNKYLSRGICKQRPYMYYRLKKPINNTYYIIYNDKNRVVKEGVYKNQNIIGDKKSAGFYNNKYFTYKFRKLWFIDYQKEGRNFKREFYKGENKLKSIEYFNKESGNIEKKEIYKKNKLVETMPYVIYSVKDSIENENSTDSYIKKIFSYKYDKLYRIVYEKKGKAFKVEFYRGKNKLKSIVTYDDYDKKFNPIDITEIYKKNKLKETRFYVTSKIYYSILNKCGEKCNSELYSELLNSTEKKLKKAGGWRFKGNKYVFKIKKNSDLIDSKELEKFKKEVER